MSTENRLPQQLREFIDGMGPDALLVRVAPEEQAEMRAEAEIADRRDALLAQLIFAARDLAESRIIWDNGFLRTCNEPNCRAHSRTVEGVPPIHAESCRAGRVLRIVDELIELAKPTRAIHEKRIDREGPSADLSEEDAMKILRGLALDEIAQINSVTMRCNACGASVTGMDKSAANLVHSDRCWAAWALAATKGGR